MHSPKEVEIQGVFSFIFDNETMKMFFMKASRAEVMRSDPVKARWSSLCQVEHAQ